MTRIYVSEHTIAHWRRNADRLHALADRLRLTDPDQATVREVACACEALVQGMEAARDVTPTGSLRALADCHRLASEMLADQPPAVEHEQERAA